MDVGARVVSKSEAIEMFENTIAKVLPDELMKYWRSLLSRYASEIDQNLLAS